MMEDRYNPVHQKAGRTAPAERIPEARYAYYRRCQVFRKGGEQCKAPAEKGSLICHAHAGQLAMAVRRERERRAVLEEAVAEMRRRGNPEFEAKDLFMDFKGIQVTIAVMARAVINGRIDCKTAGRLVVQLQTASKLLRMMQRTSTTEARRHGEEPRLPQIAADERREKASTARTSITEDTRSTPLLHTQERSGQATEHAGTVEMRTVKVSESSENADRARIAEVIVIRKAERTNLHSERANGPPKRVKAA
jgi:hypothetical protein